MYFEGTLTFNEGWWADLSTAEYGAVSLGESYTVTLGTQTYESEIKRSLFTTGMYLGDAQYDSLFLWGGTYPFCIRLTEAGVFESFEIQDTTITSLYVKIQLTSEITDEPDPEPEEPEIPIEPVAPPTDYVINRTQADVDRWRELRDKGYPDLTNAERSEWLGYMKGRYSHDDLNRVERAVQRISEKMIEMGYLTTAPAVKTDWSVGIIPTNAMMQRYLGNIARLRNAIDVYPETPSAPDVNERMSYTIANDIEKILMDIEYILTAIPAGWFYVGDLYSGEV